MEQSKIRILLIDDNPTEADYIKETFARARKQDFAVKHVTTLADALALLREERFDVVLMDLGLPDSQGLDSALSVRRQDKQVAIVTLTTLDDEETALKSLELDIQDYLIKSELHSLLLLRTIPCAMQRKKVTAAFEELHAEVQAVIDSMNDALIVADMNGNIKTFNHAASRLAAYMDMEQLPKHISQYLEYFELRDLVGRSLTLEEWPLSRAMRGERFTDYEIVVRNRKTDSTFIGNYSGTPVFDKEGKGICALVSIRDVTEQKKAEEGLRVSEANYRTIFNSANDAIFVHDAESGNILDINQKMLEMYKYTKEEAGNITVMDLTGNPKVTDKEIQSLIQSAASEGPKVFDWLAKDKEGRLFWVEVSLKQVVLQGKTRVVALVRDITERKEAEENLKRAINQVTRSNRELEQFAYVASHDLQEPLRTVTGFLTLLSKRYHGQLDEKADQYIDFAVDGIKRMQRLISALLEYSRSIRGTAPFSSVNIEKVLADALSNLSGVIEETGAEIRHEPLPNVTGDENQLLRLFQNLVSNALKFRRPGVKPIVNIDVKQEQGNWVFSVCDNGIGIDPAHHEAIFQPFRRLHTHQEYPGTGIGLAACKKIVEHHGGSICVESESGKGACFYFTIPLSPRGN